MGGSNEVTARIPDALCELDRYGQKNGKGYYQYDEGDRTPKPDNIADEVIEDVSNELGYTRREFSDDEILKRCIYPLVNIGAKLLEEGNLPGLALWSRPPIAGKVANRFDAPITTRYDEGDCMLVFKDVEVPWAKVVVHDNPALSRNIFIQTPC